MANQITFEKKTRPGKYAVKIGLTTVGELERRVDITGYRFWKFTPDWFQNAHGVMHVIAHEKFQTIKRQAASALADVTPL